MSWSPDTRAPETARFTPETFAAFADYFDGETAIRHRVGLRLAGDRLDIALPEGRRLYWPLDDLRALPDQADPATMVLSRASDPLPRLVLAAPDLAARIRAAAPGLRRRPPVEHKRRIATWAAGAVASVALIIFVLVPALANRLALWLPPDGERALGEAVFQRIRADLSDSGDPVAVCTDPAGLAALEAMRQRLNADKDLPYPVTLAVLDFDGVNAFALPGGRVTLFRGLIDQAQGPDEVAAVLAHELGHVAHRDSARDALRFAGSVGVLGLIFGDFAGGTVALMIANQLIDANYSQAAESAADDYASALMTAADLPPAAMASLFTRLRDKSGEDSGLVAHLASHPQMTARIEAALAAQRAAEAAGHLQGPPALDAAAWHALQGICGVPAPDGPSAGGKTPSGAPPAAGRPGETGGGGMLGAGERQDVARGRVGGQK